MSRIRTIHSLSTVKKIPDLPLSYKYSHVLRFRQRADTRVSILKRILPEEFTLSDYVLFHCLYFDPKGVLKTSLRDQNSIGVSFQQRQIVRTGEIILTLKTRAWAFNHIKSRLNPETSMLDMLPAVWKEARSLDSFAIRTHFLNQFLDSLEKADKLALEIAPNKEPRSIKIEQSVRHKVVPALIGFIKMELGDAKCDKFVQEFVINGRLSKTEDYFHKGLRELYKQDLTNVYK